MNSTQTEYLTSKKVEKFPCTFGALLKLIFVYIVIAIGLAVIFIIAQETIEVFFFPKGEDFKINLENGFGSTFFSLLSFLALVFYVKTKPNRTWENILRFKPVTPTLLLSLTPLILGTVILSSEIDNLLRYFIDLPDYFKTMLLDLSKNPFTGFIFLVIVAPFTEEIIFRGIILEGLVSRYSRWKAIFFSAIVFSIWHLNPIQFFSAFLFGLISGYLYLNTHSLIPCIVFHSLENGLAFMSRYLPPDIPGVTNDPLGEAQFQPICLDFLGLVLFLIGVWTLGRVLNKSPDLKLKHSSFKGIRSAVDFCSSSQEINNSQRQT